MAGEIQINFDTGLSLYFMVRSATGTVWNTGTAAFEAYNSANYANYVVALTEESGSGGFYKGNFPSTISAGVYGVTAKHALAGNGSEAAGDPVIGIENFQWTGTAPFPLSDLATSGLVGQGFPQRVARGTMIKNFPLYFRSAADHVTPLTSGTVSGQIIRDSGVWGALESGAFVNQGNGFYNLMALTSGDLLADTVKLLFTAADVSGGTSDPVAFGWILNRVSGAN